ncbi:MAG: hypothetical protein LBP51_07590 [Deferribacteraceae bacterium]|nr:hypothetical protein [Deferribacteraceae bacterium]
MEIIAYPTFSLSARGEKEKFDSATAKIFAKKFLRLQLKMLKGLAKKIRTVIYKVE